MASLLVGVRVLDLSRYLPGPFCTQILADMGAEVIKIERPDGGDESRSISHQIRGHGTSFLMLNRSKKSMTLNLKLKAGVEVFRRLAGRSDVVVESFRPGVTERLGIDYQKLKRDNRKLIYLSLTGYGQTGPYAARAGHDINYMSYAGMAGLTGPRDGSPVPTGTQTADIAGGAMMAAFSIVGALYHRERTGRGQYIDVSMMDGALAVGQSVYGEFLARDEDPGPGNMRLSGGNPPYNIYETRDGKFFALGALERKFWDNFCDRAGREDLKDRHRPDDDQERYQLEDELKDLFKTKTRDEWTELLADAEACGSPVLGLSELRDDPQVKARQMIVDAPHPDGGTLPQMAFPVKFSELEARPPEAAPELGEHTDKMLQAAGYSKKDIEELKKEGVV